MNQHDARRILLFGYSKLFANEGDFQSYIGAVSSLVEVPDDLMAEAFESYDRVQDIGNAPKAGGDSDEGATPQQAQTGTSSSLEGEGNGEKAIDCTGERLEASKRLLVEHIEKFRKDKRKPADVKQYFADVALAANVPDDVMEAAFDDYTKTYAVTSRGAINPYIKKVQTLFDKMKSAKQSASKPSKKTALGRPVGSRNKKDHKAGGDRRSNHAKTKKSKKQIAGQGEAI